MDRQCVSFVDFRTINDDRVYGKPSIIVKPDLVYIHIDLILNLNDYKFSINTFLIVLTSYFI